MQTISTFYALIGFGAIFGTMLLARLDYRAKPNYQGLDWDAR